jgi:hypothetical protein
VSEVFSMNGRPLVAPEPESQGTQLAIYFRGVADMLDRGALDATAAVVILAGPAATTAQVINVDKAYGLGLLEIGKHALLSQ